MTAPSIVKKLQQAIQHHQAGRLPEAEALYREILGCDPRCADALHLLGAIAHQRGNHVTAVEQISRAAALAPKNPAIHSNLGEAYRHLHRLDEAVASFRRALALQPNYPDALSNLGNALVTQGQLDEAVNCFRRAVALQPNFANAHNNLGTALEELGELDQAFACYQRAIALQPDLAGAHSNLGTIYKERGELDEALTCYRRALTLRPDSLRFHSNLILVMHYHSGHEPIAIDAELQRWNLRHARPLAKFIRPHANDRNADRRLRIGYVSPDFRSHPVGWFLLPLLAAHDRRSFEVFCYSCVQRPDTVTAQLRAQVDGWHDLTERTDQQAADLIREHRIDLLVDLALHTTNNRLPIFAHKPAPVQATYLAYSGNSGLDTIDYRITDPHLDPPRHEDGQRPEQPIHLPETYWCYQSVLHPSPEVSALPALNKGHVTFGCLNSFCKVTPATIAAWCRLLLAVPNSRLLLHSRPGGHRSRVRASFASNAVDPQRIDFIDRDPVPKAQYFQMYQSIDIGLDPFPFPGGATTCDALWMGVPVISLAGPTPVTRSGLTLLSNVGLSELVAHSVDDYIVTAAHLARDLSRLAALRAGLRERMLRSPLMDAPRFARHLEAAYRTMWHRWCAQATPAAGPNR